MFPTIKYARAGDLQIAYQVIGEGDLPLVVVNGWVSNVEENWNLPGVSEWIAALSKFCKLIVFDKRGVGLSDRVNESQLPELDERMEDITAILNQENIEKAALFGFSEGGTIAILFAATYPERTRALILFGSYACWKQMPDYPIGIPLELHEKSLQLIANQWGTPIGLRLMAPSIAEDETYQRAWAAFLRRSASPKTAEILYRMNLEIDVRYLLSELSMPTLVLHRRGDRLMPVAFSQYLAAHIPNAALFLLEGHDHFPWIGDTGAVLRAIGDFLGVSTAKTTAATAICTLLAMKKPEDSAVLQQITNTDEFYYFEQDKNLILVFSGPTAALKWASQLERGGKMVLHTGAGVREPGRIEGAVVEVAQDLLLQMQRPALWVTQSARNLLSALHFQFDSERPLTAQGLPMTVFAFKKMFQTEAPQALSDDKIRPEDILILQKVQRHLDLHFHADFSLEELSRQFGINTFKLKYGFKKLTGSSVKQYMLSLRLEYAHQLIQKTDAPITEIAYDLGYRQPGNFTRAFTKKFGISPDALRKGFNA